MSNRLIALSGLSVLPMILRAAEAETGGAPAEPTAEARPRVNLYADTVLDQGRGAEFITRPKMKAIVDAFGGGQTLADGLKVAGEAMAEKLTSAAFKEDPEGYLRGYVPQLIAAQALVVTEPGTAPAKAEPAPKAPAAEKPLSKKAQKAADKAAAEAAAKASEQSDGTINEVLPEGSEASEA